MFLRSCSLGISSSNSSLKTAAKEKDKEDQNSSGYVGGSCNSCSKTAADAAAAAPEEVGAGQGQDPSSVSSSSDSSSFQELESTSDLGNVSAATGGSDASTHLSAADGFLLGFSPVVALLNIISLYAEKKTHTQIKQEITQLNEHEHAHAPHDHQGQSRQLDQCCGGSHHLEHRHGKVNMCCGEQEHQQYHHHRHEHKSPSYFEDEALEPTIKYTGKMKKLLKKPAVEHNPKKLLQQFSKDNNVKEKRQKRLFGFLSDSRLKMVSYATSAIAGVCSATGVFIASAASGGIGFVATPLVSIRRQWNSRQKLDKYFKHLTNKETNNKKFNKKDKALLEFMKKERKEESHGMVAAGAFAGGLGLLFVPGVNIAAGLTILGLSVYKFIKQNNRFTAKTAYRQQDINMREPGMLEAYQDRQEILDMFEQHRSNPLRKNGFVIKKVSYRTSFKLSVKINARRMGVAAWNAVMTNVFKFKKWKDPKASKEDIVREKELIQDTFNKLPDDKKSSILTKLGGNNWLTDDYKLALIQMYETNKYQKPFVNDYLYGRAKTFLAEEKEEAAAVKIQSLMRKQKVLSESSRRFLDGDDPKNCLRKFRFMYKHSHLNNKIMQSVNERRDYVTNMLKRPFWLDSKDDLGVLDKANISSFRDFLNGRINCKDVTGF